MINTGALSYEKLVVRIFPFLTQWLRIFAKNERYHSAIIYNFLISLMINVSGKWALKRTLYFSKKIASTKNLAQGRRTTMMFMPSNRIISPCKIQLSRKILPAYEFSTLKFLVTPFFNGKGCIFLHYYILLCNTQIGWQSWAWTRCQKLLRDT